MPIKYWNVVVYPHRGLTWQIRSDREPLLDNDGQTVTVAAMHLFKTDLEGDHPGYVTEYWSFDRANVKHVEVERKVIEVPSADDLL